MTNRMGRVPDFHNFDNDYFGFNERVTDVIDPESRLLLEATYEAIVDAGKNT